MDQPSVEKFVRPEVVETDGGIYRYSKSLGFNNEKSFLRFIQNKRVLDVGSGHGRFAKEVAGRHLSVKVISVNPTLANEYFREQERENTKTMAHTHIGFANYTEKELQKIQKEHDSHAVAAVAQALPFIDNAFDIVLDCNAIAYHTINREHFQKAVEELLRVVKPGGVVMMNMLTNTSDPGLSPDWQIGVIDDLKLKYEVREDFTLPYEKVIEIVKLQS